MATAMGMKWFVDFIAEKIQLDSFEQSDNSVIIDLKMNKSNLAEKSSYYARVAFLLSRLRWRSYSVSIAKAASKKIGALICS